MKRHGGLGEGVFVAKNLRLSASLHGSSRLTSLPYCASSERLRREPETDAVGPQNISPVTTVNNPSRFEIFVPSLKHLQAVDTQQLISDRLARSSSQAARIYREAKNEGKLDSKNVEAMMMQLAIRINLVVNTLGPAEPIERFERFLRDAEGTSWDNVERKFIAYFEVLTPRPGSGMQSVFEISKPTDVDGSNRNRNYVDIMEVLGSRNFTTSANRYLTATACAPPIFDIAVAVLDLAQLGKTVRSCRWHPIEHRAQPYYDHCIARDTRVATWDLDIKDSPYRDLATSLNGLVPTLFDFQVPNEDLWMWRTPGANKDASWPQESFELPYNWPNANNPREFGDGTGENRHRLSFARLAGIDLLHRPQEKWAPRTFDIPGVDAPNFPWDNPSKNDSPSMTLIYGPKEIVFPAQGMSTGPNVNHFYTWAQAGMFQHTQKPKRDRLPATTLYRERLRFFRHVIESDPPYDYASTEPTQAMLLLADLHNLSLGKINGPTLVPEPQEKLPSHFTAMDVFAKTEPAIDSPCVKTDSYTLSVFTPTPWQWASVTPSFCAPPYPPGEVLLRDVRKTKARGVALCELSPFAGLFQQALNFKHWSKVHTEVGYEGDWRFFAMCYEGTPTFTYPADLFFNQIMGSPSMSITHGNVTFPPVEICSVEGMFFDTFEKDILLKKSLLHFTYEDMHTDLKTSLCTRLPPDSLFNLTPEIVRFLNIFSSRPIQVRKSHESVITNEERDACTDFLQSPEKVYELISKAYAPVLSRKPEPRTEEIMYLYAKEMRQMDINRETNAVTACLVKHPQNPKQYVPPDPKSATLHIPLDNYMNKSGEVVVEMECLDSRGYPFPFKSGSVTTCSATLELNLN